MYNICKFYMYVDIFCIMHIYICMGVYKTIYIYIYTICMYVYICIIHIYYVCINLYDCIYMFIIYR